MGSIPIDCIFLKTNPKNNPHPQHQHTQQPTAPASARGRRALTREEETEGGQAEDPDLLCVTDASYTHTAPWCGALSPAWSAVGSRTSSAPGAAASIAVTSASTFSRVGRQPRMSVVGVWLGERTRLAGGEWDDEGPAARLPAALELVAWHGVRGRGCEGGAQGLASDVRECATCRARLMTCGSASSPWTPAAVAPSTSLTPR